MKINRIDRGTMSYIDGELTKRLNELGDELGLSIRIAGGSYGSAVYHPKLEIKVVDAATGQVIDPYFDTMCRSHGLDPNLISRDGYKLVGYKASRPKYPWDVENVRGGRNAKAPHSWVAARFKTGTPGSIPTIASQITPAAQAPAPNSGQASDAGVEKRAVQSYPSMF